ncbi:MAG: ABC transporter substrate-binding protein [Ruminococcus flavefaciens]|nr:ABC transporter substrate-binding protein [Ruminococcus flavefaciens]
MKKICAVLSAVMLATAVSCSEVSTVSQMSESMQQEISENTTEKREDVTITMAVLDDVRDPYLKEAVNNFNEADNGYKIVFKNYMDYYDKSYETENGTTPEAFARIDTQLSLDIMESGIVDIVPSSVFCDSGKYDSLMKQGAFADLYEFMQAENYDDSVLYKHILELYETDSKLCCMPLAFKIDTVAGYTRYVGDKENWTIEEMIEHWQAMPEGSTFNGHTTKDYVYMTILRNNISSFVDFENHTTNYDSPEFIKILEFINSFDPPESYKQEMNWNTPHFIMNFQIYDFEGFHGSLWNEQGEPVTVVGYPSPDESGILIDTYGYKYSVCEYSSPEVKQGAWEFIKTLVDYDIQYDMIKGHFPVNYEVFKKKGEEEYSKYGQPDMIIIQGTEHDIGYLSPEEYNYLVSLIDSAKKANVSIEEDITKIIEEELYSMFAGEKTPEETAQIIDNRAGILISERY